jgi:hypothetical protein
MNHRQDSVNSIGKTLAREVLQNFGEVRLCVFGTSMLPSILPGDFISIQRAALNDISLGEVVLFLREDRLFVHRVVNRILANLPDSFQEPCLITRGDRLRHDDPPVSSVELLGRIVLIQRGNQRFKPAAPRSRSRRILTSALRASDLAAYLFLNTTVCWRFVFPEKSAPCQV